jgi:hypothetical protein
MWWDAERDRICAPWFPTPKSWLHSDCGQWCKDDDGMLVEIRIQGQTYYYQAESPPEEFKVDAVPAIKKQFETAQAAEALMANMPAVEPTAGLELTLHTPGVALLYFAGGSEPLDRPPKLNWLGSHLSICAH